MQGVTIIFLLDLFKKQKTPAVKSGSIWQNTAFNDIINSSDKRFSTDRQELSAYNQVAWVAIATDHLMRDAGNRPFWFEDKDGNELDIKKIPEQITYPIQTGYANQSFGQLLSLMVGHRAITGNAYLWKVQLTAFGKVRGVIEAFVPITPDKVKPLISGSGLFLEGYEITLSDGNKKTVLPEEIIHFSQNTMLSPFIGMGNIEKARLMYEAELRKDEYSNSFFRRGASPSMIITEDGDRTADEIIRISEKMNDKYGGSDNTGKLMYLAGKGITATPLSLSQKDMQFLEEKKYNRQTVLSLFGVPPVVGGIPESTNKATAEVFRNQYLADTINPIICDLEETITRQFIQPINSEIVLRFQKHATGDVDNVIKKLQAGIITPNMAADVLGEPIDDEDETRDMYYMPSGYLPMGVEPPSAPSTPPMPEDDPAESDDPENEDPAENDPEKMFHMKHSCNDPHHWEHICKSFNGSIPKHRRFQVAYLRDSLKARAKVEDTYTPVLEKFFKEQKQRIVHAIIENKEKLKPLLIATQQHKHLQEKGKREEPIVDIIFNLNEEDTLIKKVVKPMHTSAVQRGVMNTNAIAGSTVNPNLSNPYIGALIDRLGKNIVDGMTVNGKEISVNDTTRKEIGRLVADAIDNDLSISDMTTLINEQLGGDARLRARRIARTESRTAYDEGSKSAYKELGVQFVDVVGCEHFESDSDCGAVHQPIDKQLQFHPNHIGTIVPSEEP